MDSHDYTGFVAFMAGGAIAWNTKRQTIVATSATDSEVLATSYAVKRAEIIRIALYYLKASVPTPMAVFNDNSGCVFTSRTDSTKNTRQLAVHANYIRDRVMALKTIRIGQVPTKDMAADFFTKPLPAQDHWRHLDTVFNRRSAPHTPAELAPKMK